MKKFFVFIFMSAAVWQQYGAVVVIKPVELRNYRVNEDITFSISGVNDDKSLMKEGKFTVSFRYCGNKEICKKLTVDLAVKNPVLHTVKLDKPGFILAVPSAYKTSDGRENKWKNRHYACGGAAVDPEKIRQAGTVPEDFDIIFSVLLFIFLTGRD